MGCEDDATVTADATTHPSIQVLTPPGVGTPEELDAAGGDQGEPVWDATTMPSSVLVSGF